MDSPRSTSPGPDARRPQSLREVQPTGTPPTVHTPLLHDSMDTTYRTQEAGEAPPNHYRNFLDSVRKYWASLPCSPCLRGGEQTSSTPDAANPSTPAAPRRVISVEPGVTPSPALRSFDRGERRAIDQGATLSAGDSGLPYERSYKFDLKRAIKGVEKFKELCDAVKDKNWKDALVNSQEVDELQALYLGIN